MNAKRFRFAHVLLAALVAVSTLARAQHASPAAAEHALKQLAVDRNLPHHERALPSGDKRIAVNVSSQTDLNAFAEITGRGQNVLQIVHSAARGNMHTKAIFDGELIHLQTPTNFRTWKLNVWGNSLRESSTATYSALIHLTPIEANNLRARIATARAQMKTTPDGTMTDAFGQRGMNCASGWCGVQVGEKGEPLWSIAGLRGETGAPWSFQQELESSRSDRVFGLAILGPKVADFGNKANEQLFKFGY